MDTQKPIAGLLFSYAFRSLFLLAVAQALFGITLWFAWWSGVVSIQWQINPVYWHGHDMIMGFAGAAIGGFLLTAVATWTGRAPVKGWPLVVLCIVWLSARLGPVFPTIAAVSGVFYWIWLLLLMTREVVAARNRRNYKVLFMLAAFLILEILFCYGELAQVQWQRTVIWAQVWLVLVMINLIGGRIIPAFTRNWLLKQHTECGPAQLPSPFGPVDVIASVALVVFALSTLFPVPTRLLLLVTFATALLQTWRLLRWKGFHTFINPLVWMLHLSYAWIPLGVLLFGLGLAGYLPISAGIHTLTIGTVTGMIVSVSSRAALGHTGHPLISHPLLTCAILLLGLATVSRVIATQVDNNLVMTGAAFFWISGFLCFAFVYVPVLISPPVSQSQLVEKP